MEVKKNRRVRCIITERLPPGSVEPIGTSTSVGSSRTGDVLLISGVLLASDMFSVERL